MLVIGGLAEPLAARFVPGAGQVGLTAVAIVAFAVAGWRIGAAAIPAVQGVVAALSSYCLILPLVLFLAGDRNVVQIGLTAALAVVVGGIAGFLSGLASGVRGRPH